MRRLVEVNQRYGTGLLIVEQNVPITLQAIDRAVILNTGRCVFNGEASKLENDGELVAQHLGVYRAHQNERLQN